MARMISYPGIKCMVHVRLKVACEQLRPGGWSLCLQCGGKERTVTPFCL